MNQSICVVPLPSHRNVEDVRIQHHADELMCMTWCAMSHTADIHKNTVARTMFCNEAPVKDASKSHLHRVVRTRSCAWCVASGARAMVDRWFSCFMILSGHKPWFQIGLDHCHVVPNAGLCNAFYIIHCFFAFCFSIMIRIFSKNGWIWDHHHHVLRTPYTYDVVWLLCAQERTRCTHTVSCGWANVHGVMRNESDMRSQRILTSTPLHAPCSYKNCAAAASLLLGIFVGFILYNHGLLVNSQ